VAQMTSRGHAANTVLWSDSSWGKIRQDLQATVNVVGFILRTMENHQRTLMF
jgi:hypothetical protein